MILIYECRRPETLYWWLRGYGFASSGRIRKKRKTLGFDINQKRIEQLNKNIDCTLENSKEELCASTMLRFSSSCVDLKDSNCYIITVPTPIDEYNQPDLEPLKNGTIFIGKYLEKKEI